MRSETFTGRSASGVGPSGSMSRSAPLAASGAAGAKQASTSARSTPSPASRSAAEPRARQPARDVVLQVGVEEAVAAVQLGRGADGRGPRCRARRA